MRDALVERGRAEPVAPLRGGRCARLGRGKVGMARKSRRKGGAVLATPPDYANLFEQVAGVVDEARRTSARAINSLMTATYWLIGERIVVAEQGGKERAGYGEQIVERLSADLTERFGRGFGRSNLFQIRAFYLAYADILQTPSGQSVALPTGD